MSDWLVDESLAPDADDLVLGPLYSGAARGELTLPFCPSCEAPVEIGSAGCVECRRTDVQWRVVAPTGVVHAATVVHRLEPGLIRTAQPYPVLDVEVSSGHRLIAATRDPATDAPPVGTPVAIGFRRVGDTHVPAALLEVRP